jgi:fatty acid amide hydrolase
MVFDPQAFSSKKKLRIGYFTSVPLFPPIGDTVETVERAKVSLEGLGHTLIPFTIPDVYDMMRISGKFLFTDNCKSFKALW